MDEHIIIDKQGIPTDLAGKREHHWEHAAQIGQEDTRPSLAVQLKDHQRANNWRDYARLLWTVLRGT